MKVEIKEKEQVKERDFPKLMVGKITGVVVLMNNETDGTVIIGNNYYKIGQHIEGFSHGVFTDFEGSITLSNE